MDTMTAERYMLLLYDRGRFDATALGPASEARARAFLADPPYPWTPRPTEELRLYRVERCDVPTPRDTRDLAEEGRRLASAREDLIAQGVPSNDLHVPLHPADGERH